MIEYLQSPAPKLWQPADDGDAFVWTDDTSHHLSQTITMSAELAVILRPLSLALAGLPSLTSVLFVIAALRANPTRSEANSVKDWTPRLKAIGGRSIQADGVAKWLHQLAFLPEDVRAGMDGPLATLGCGLENCRRYLVEIDAESADEVIGALELPANVRDPAILESQTNTGSARSPRCKRAWETLLFLSRSGVDAEQLRTWKATGLVRLPKPPETPLPPPPRDPINRLLRDLIDDEELAGLAKISRTASALVTLPRRPSDPDLLPMGGVSDVTNRGNPERLLMTELAADPMLLLARIATGQSLYLRRETPPGPSPNRRPVAIESGIRCWGNTRVHLAALALAIGASEEKRGDTLIEFSVVTNDRTWVNDMTSREGLTNHLSTLDPSEHPGGGIAAWFESITAACIDEDEVSAEPLILVSSATDADANFRESIRDVPRPFLIATVDATGNIVMSRRTGLGDEVLQTLSLEMPDVSRKPPPSHSADERPPWFLNLRPAPLSYSVDSQITWCCPTRDSNHRPQVWLVTGNLRLMLARSMDQGATEVCDDLPSSSVLAYQATPAGLDLVLGKRDNRQHVIRVDESGHVTRRFHLPEDFIATDVAIVGEHILRFSRDGYQECSLADGDVFPQKRLGLQSLGLGFALRSDGVGLRYRGQFPDDWHVIQAPVDDPITLIQRPIIGMSDQPIVLAKDLSCLLKFGDEIQRVTTNQRVDGDPGPIPIMRDHSGRYWMVKYQRVRSVQNISGHRVANGNLFCVDTVKGHVKLVHDDHHGSILAALDMPARGLVQQRSVRRKFQSATMTREGLVLKQSIRSALRVQASLDPPQRLVAKPIGPDETKNMRGFQDVAAPELRGQRHKRRARSLRRAEIDGGWVWLDSRGLVHLQRNNDPRELTLVIADKHVAGWFSDTGSFGPRFFLPYEDVGAGTTETRSGSVPVPDAVVNWLMDWSRDL